MCMIDMADGDPPEFLNSTTIKAARKDHKCSECDRVISVGESYQKTTGMNEGKVWTFTACVHCMVACEWLEEECGGFLYSSVLEDILDHIDEGYEGLDGIRDGMRAKWRDANGELLPVPELTVVKPYQQPTRVG